MIDEAKKEEIKKQLFDCVKETDDLISGICTDSINPEEAELLSEIKRSLEELKSSVDLSLVNSKVLEVLNDKKADLIKVLDKQPAVGLKAPSPFNKED